MENVTKIECSVLRPAKWIKAKKPGDKDYLYFPNPSGVANLIEYVNSPANREKVQALRSAKTEDDKNRIKSTLPTCTPSAKFHPGEPRRTESKYTHTGFMCMDIDAKHNPHISNFSSLKPELAKIENVAAVFTSAGGAGYFILIPIAKPEKHREHFAAVEAWFKSKGLILDNSCKDEVRLRFCTWDPEPYINPDAPPLFWCMEEMKPKKSAAEISGESTVFSRYNAKLDFVDVLQKHGWSIERETKQKITFTRPGKSAGLSADYTYSKNVFYVFSSNAEPFEERKGYNPFQVFSLLEHGGDNAEAAKALEADEDFNEEI